MDEKALELAEEHQLMLVSSTVAQIQARVKPPDPAFDGMCVECGDPVPQVRITFGAETCISCQEYLEQLQRLGPRRE